MKKDMIFFGARGITSTSANTVANWAKESLLDYESKIENTNLYGTTVSLMGSVVEQPIRVASEPDAIKAIPAYLEKIAKTKSLIAWLREAIKARENLKLEAQKTTMSEWAELMNVDYPEEPQKAPVLTEDEYYGSLSISDRNRYYYLETVCSTIGKYIHPDGDFAAARKELKRIKNKPYEVKGTGRDSTIYKNMIPDGMEKSVEDTFFELQNTHRDYQKQLNAMKYNCERAIMDSAAKSNADYQVALHEFGAKLNEIRAAYKAWVDAKNKEISDLKIVIPDGLQSIFDEITMLGKAANK